MKAIPLILSCLNLSAEAHTLMWKISLEVESAPDAWSQQLLWQIFPGSVEVESSLIQGAPDEQLAFDADHPNFTIMLDFDDQSYSALSDPAAGYPLLYFVDGELQAMDYLVYLDTQDYAPNSFFHLQPDGRMSYSPNGVGEFEGNYRISPVSVPETSTISFLGVGALIILTYRKR